MFDLFFGIWSFVFHHSSALVCLVALVLEIVRRIPCGTETVDVLKPRTVLRKYPRADAMRKHVALQLNELKEKHWRRGRRAILKHVKTILAQSKRDGARNRNAVVYGVWDATATTKLCSCKPKKLPIRDAQLPWWTQDIDSPSISPSDTRSSYQCDDDSYLVSEFGDGECYVPKPKPARSRSDRLVDPKEAYFWFLLIRSAIVEFHCADYKLDTNCSPLVLVAMIHLGWISLVDAVSFTESREMLGEGLVRASLLHKRCRYDHLLDQMRTMGRPTYEDMRPFQIEWEWHREKTRERQQLLYDSIDDRFDRITNGPFGAPFVSYASANDLENIMDTLLHSASRSVTMDRELDALLKPLSHRSLTYEELQAAKSRTSSGTSTSTDTSTGTSTGTSTDTSTSTDLDSDSWYINSNVTIDEDIIMTDLTTPQKPEDRQCSRVWKTSSSSPFELLREDNTRMDLSSSDSDSSLIPESEVVVKVSRFHPYRRPALKKHI